MNHPLLADGFALLWVVGAGKKARVTSNPVFSLFATPKSLGPFCLRMLLVVVFTIHGGQKAFGWFGGEGWTATLRKFSDPTGLDLSVATVIVLIVGELLVVVAMFVGLFTRVAAFGVMLIMGGALALVHIGGGWAEVQYPVTIFVVGLALFFQGGGAFSLDRAISNTILPVYG